LDFKVFDTVETIAPINAIKQGKGFLIHCAPTSSSIIFNDVTMMFDNYQIAYIGNNIQILSNRIVLTEKYDSFRDIILKTTFHI